MANRTILARLDDMFGAIAAIERIERQSTEIEPWLAKLGRERAFQILSEASRHIPDDLKSTEPDIEWRDIAGIGNVLRHDYQAVSDDVLRNAAAHQLQSLKAALARIMTLEERRERGTP